MQRRSNAPEEPVEPLDESDQAKVIQHIVQTYRKQQSQIIQVFTIVCYMAIGIAVFITYIVQSEDSSARQILLVNATPSPHLPTFRYLHCLCTVLLHWNTPKIVGTLGPKSDPPSLNDLIPAKVSFAWSIYVPVAASLVVGAMALWMVRISNSGSTDYHALYYHYILWGGNAVLMGAATFIRRDQEGFIASLKELYKARYAHKAL